MEGRRHVDEPAFIYVDPFPHVLLLGSRNVTGWGRFGLDSKFNCCMKLSILKIEREGTAQGQTRNAQKHDRINMAWQPT